MCEAKKRRCLAEGKDLPRVPLPWRREAGAILNKWRKVGDNGKENGSYRNYSNYVGVIWGYIGIASGFPQLFSTLCNFLVASRLAVLFIELIHDCPHSSPSAAR